MKCQWERHRPVRKSEHGERAGQVMSQVGPLPLARQPNTFFLGLQVPQTSHFNINVQGCGLPWHKLQSSPKYARLCPFNHHFFWHPIVITAVSRPNPSVQKGFNRVRFSETKWMKFWQETDASLALFKQQRALSRQGQRRTVEMWLPW